MAKEMENHKNKQPLEEQLKNIIKRKSDENAALNKLLEQLENSIKDDGNDAHHSMEKENKKNL